MTGNPAILGFNAGAIGYVVTLGFSLGGVDPTRRGPTAFRSTSARVGPDAAYATSSRVGPDPERATSEPV
jgi:hypothetical protein